MKKVLAISIAAVMFIGCGGSSGSSSEETTVTQGEFIDAPVKGAIFKSPSYNGITDENGKYICKDNETIAFYAGGTKLGEVLCHNLTTPLSLAHGNSEIAKNIAYFIQNLDEDQNPDDGITLPTDLPAIPVDFTDTSSVEDALYALGKTPRITPDEAYQNFERYALQMHYNSNLAISTPIEANLTYDQKYALAYMWNEEKMAKDLYLALNELYPNQTLYNIATRSETQHEASVENLAEIYDINLTNLNNFEYHFDANELAKYGQGEFFIPEVQETYNTLYEKGSKSLVDALEVGCMVEVTDINDLNKWLDVVKDQPAIVTVFENLRSGSYNHYWAFDNALKSLGISEGCCVLGEEYCKTPDEYPIHNNGYMGGNGYHGGR